MKTITSRSLSLLLLTFATTLPLASAAPLPLRLLDSLKSVSHTPPATTVRSTRPPHALPEIIRWGPDEDDAGFVTSIDNSPFTPSATADRTLVLQATRPLVTEYLLAISRDEDGDKDGGAGKEKGGERDDVGVLKEAEAEARLDGGGGEDDLFVSVSEMEVVIPVAEARERMRMMVAPCGGAEGKYLSREQSDMLIICLAVVFLLAVVVLETCGSLSLRSRSTSEGAIRLGDEKDTAAAGAGGTRGLSIQADEYRHEVVQDLKESER